MLKRCPVVFAILLLVGSGCTSSQTTPTAPPSVDVTGTWAGTWSRGSLSGSSTLRLSQTGSKVLGDVAVLGVSDFIGPLEGSVAGNQFSYRLLSGRGGADFTVTGDEMSGYGSSTGIRLQYQRQK